MKPYYEHGGITIFHGDCRRVFEYIAEIADCVVTDPPYAISVAGSVHVGQPGGGSRRLDFFPGDSDWTATVAMWIEALQASLRRLSPSGSVYAWVGHREFGPTVACLEERGFNTRPIAWVKKCPAPPPPGSGWPSGFEMGVFGSRPGRIWTHDGTKPPPATCLPPIHSATVSRGRLDTQLRSRWRAFNRLLPPAQTSAAWFWTRLWAAAPHSWRRRISVGAPLA